MHMESLTLVAPEERDELDEHVHEPEFVGEVADSGAPKIPILDGARELRRPRQPTAVERGRHIVTA